jgi:hypothetical protein
MPDREDVFKEMQYCQFYKITCQKFGFELYTSKFLNPVITKVSYIDLS